MCAFSARQLHQLQFLKTFYRQDIICGCTGGINWEILSSLEAKNSLCFYLCYSETLYLHICLGCLKSTNICIRFLLIFTSRKARNSMRISRMTSLLLFWVPCRRRKYKSPNVLCSTSVFLALFVKVFPPAVAVEKLQNPGMKEQRYTAKLGGRVIVCPVIMQRESDIGGRLKTFFYSGLCIAVTHRPIYYIFEDKRER